jgi:3',5'-cyclic AMP phosphodiesterase CpdA
MPTLSILHISDLHFIEFGTRWRPLGHDPALASALAEFAALNKPDFDVIFVSGDLAETGRRKHLQTARDFLFADVGPISPYHSRTGRPTLQGAECDIFLMPGNHDRYWDFRGDPGCHRFDNVFKAHWEPGLCGVAGYIIPVPQSDYRLAIIAADCCLKKPSDAAPQGQREIWGQGKVHTDAEHNIVAALKTATATARALPGGHTVVIWAIHFPPSNDAQIAPCLRLLDHEKILDLAEQLNVRLILSGHIHEQMQLEPRTNGPSIWVAGTATARWFRSIPSHMVHIVQIAIDGRRPARVKVTRRNFIFTTWSHPRFTEVAAWGPGLSLRGVSWDE